MWTGMKKQFLEKFFTASRAASIKKEIYNITQAIRETLFEY